MATDFGNVPANVTLPILFTTYGKTNGESITMSGLAVTDIEIYKSTSVTQRASDNGYALVDTDGIDIDGVTGLHGISIDLSDNSDAGFYAAGSFYTVVVSTITVDSQTVTFIAATFRIVAAENTSGTPVVDLGLGRQFTAAGGASASVTLDAGASSTSNTYNGWCLYPISGTGALQAPQVITAYNGSTKVATLARSWITTTDNTTIFRMWPSAVSVEAWKLGTVPTPNFTGYPLTEVGRWANGAVPTPNQTGVPRVEVTHINNVSASSVTTVNANIGTTQPTNFTGTGASALVKGDTIDVGGTVQTARDIGASVLLSPGTGTGQVNLSSGKVPATIATGDIADISATRAGYIDILNNGTYGNSALKTLVDDIPTNAELATALGTADDAVLAQVAALATKLRKYIQLLARKDSAIATDNATELTEINANGGSGSGAFANSTDALESIRDRGDAAWVTGSGSSGTGSRIVAITVNDGANPIQSARVRIYLNGSDNQVGDTNASGQVSFSSCADGTYTVAISYPGYTFTPVSLMVDGNEAVTYSMTALNITPSEPDETTGYLTVRNSAGVAVTGATVQVQVLKLANGTVANAIDNPLATGTTDGDGLVEFPGLPRLATYQVRVGEDGKWFKGVTLDASTTPLAGALGVAE